MVMEINGKWWGFGAEGKQLFDTKKAAEDFEKGKVTPEKEAPKPKDKDLFSADAQMVVRRRKKTSKKKKPVPTNKKLYARVKAQAKRKFAVYPSAYANGWLVKTYKAKGGKYRMG